ncbi:MAG: class I SAM-dependent methyltransferase [Deltaproteobacteria bacterium]|nr:class I SAM-dependent methyltransferase [Deltaproteobacteria bacterium]MBW2697769.1 class I SAM-dependent methyltransferase [Deltaproteobacteria bacterium]
MDAATRAKWDRAAGTFDLMSSRGPEWRWAPAKREFFSAMHGKVLFLAVGTGLDIPFFPPGLEITGIDISPRMLEKAQPRADAYEGKIELLEMDVHDLAFDAGRFDQVFTSCTFCSVPNPVGGLESLRRILEPRGELRMFEHTGSRWFPFSVMMHLMTPLSRQVGPEMNRPTVENVRRAGFLIREVKHIYLDIVKTITAQAPA